MKIPSKSPGRNMLGKSSPRGSKNDYSSSMSYKSVQANLITEFQPSNSDSANINISEKDVLLGGLKDIVTQNELSAMKTEGHSKYLMALRDNLVSNEKGFVVQQCGNEKASPNIIPENFIDGVWHAMY